MSDLVYAPPGVYISEEAQAVPNINGLIALPPARVALVGPAIGYQTYTEPVVLDSTTPVELTQTGIDADTVVVTSLSGQLYAETTDYTVAQSGTPAEEAVTTVARAGGGGITDGQTVYVTYEYTNSAFYQPFLSSDWDEIQSRYGTAIDSTTGAVNSPLSLAAKIVMEQGVRELICVPTKGSSPTSVTADQIETATALLEARSDVAIVCPLPIGVSGTDGAPGETSDIGTDLKAHVTSMTTAGQARIGVYGFDVGGDRTPETVATTTASSRVVQVYPSIMQWYNGYSNSTIEIGGCYLGAAIAGILGSLAPQTPLTRKGVRSFSGIPARIFSAMTPSAKNAMSAAGVCVVEQTADGRLVARHGVSTDPTNVLTREVSIVRAKDAKMALVFRALEASGLIGSEMSEGTPVQVRSVVEGALVQCVSSKIIVNYSNLAVRINPLDSTAVDVKYAYTPAYPLNKVAVAFSVNTVTGNIEEV